MIFKIPRQELDEYCGYKASKYELEQNMKLFDNWVSEEKKNECGKHIKCNNAEGCQRCNNENN